MLLGIVQLYNKAFIYFRARDVINVVSHNYKSKL